MIATDSLALCQTLSDELITFSLYGINTRPLKSTKVTLVNSANSHWYSPFVGDKLCNL